MHILHTLAGIGLLLLPAQAAQERLFSPPARVSGITWQGLTTYYLVHRMVINGTNRTIFYDKKSQNLYRSRKFESEKGSMSASCDTFILDGRTVNPNGSTIDMQNASTWRQICNLR